MCGGRLWLLALRYIHNIIFQYQKLFVFIVNGQIHGCASVAVVYVSYIRSLVCRVCVCVCACMCV